MTITSEPSVFERWTSGRSVVSLGTNDGAPGLPFQWWHHFKEAFTPELIEQAIRASDAPVDSCFDPFGGSGTTALTAQMLGVASETIEINPFLADVIRAKVGSYDADRLVADLAAIRVASRTSAPKSTEMLGALPPTFIYPGVRDRWIFSTGIALRLTAVLAAIRDRSSSPENRRLFEVLLGGMLVDVSNVVVSGKGRRYRKNWQSCERDPAIVDQVFARRAEIAIREVHRFADRPAAPARVITGDARSTVPEGMHDLAVFSPPYPNSFDYTDVYNVQLWMLGYLQTSQDNRSLRQSTLTSHVQTARQYAPPPPGSPALDRALESLHAQRTQLWNSSLPDMVGAYFSDMLAVLRNVRQRLRIGGRCWLVVGDSSYAGTRIPVATILEQLSSTQGWELLGSTPIRHMKSSAQQGWRHELAESLVILRAA